MPEQSIGAMDKQARMFLHRVQSQCNGFCDTWADQLSPAIADALKAARESVDVAIIECDAAIPRPASSPWSAVNTGIVPTTQGTA